MGKIMVIDDNSDFLTLMETWLVSEQFDVYLCQDSASAIDRARDERPNLIILDLLMPNKPGIEVLSDLKMDSVTRKIPVIVLTAASRQAEETELLVRRLAEERMLKPFDFDHLLSRINRCLGKRDCESNLA